MPDEIDLRVEEGGRNLPSRLTKRHDPCMLIGQKPSLVGKAQDLFNAIATMHSPDIVIFIYPKAQGKAETPRDSPRW